MDTSWIVRPASMQADSPDGLDAKEPHVCNLGQRGGKMDDIWTLGVNAEDEFAWHQHALCAQTDPEAFFPEKGGVNPRGEARVLELHSTR
ncbi:hypothetical protein SK1NUM_20250 [Arachnia rubra]|nr:hypothetical protein SK1NUM_20250 [Arachnia rubra]